MESGDEKQASWSSGESCSHGGWRRVLDVKTTVFNGVVRV